MDESRHRGKAHSAESFIPSRDLWWNADFLALFRKRWGLRGIRSVLDVGCGVGHWGRTLAPILDRGTRIVGIDPEPLWVRRAARAPAASRCRFEYRIGRAEATGFPDTSFDMVTCQTVLIHVADPEGALREMLRVLKPGGLLALAEPDNFCSSVGWDSLRDETSIDDFMEDTRILRMVEMGKEILGEGNNSLGARLPALCASLGLRDLRTYLSDRAISIYPPYARPEQRIMVKELLHKSSRRELSLVKKERLRYFLAAGGKRAEFQAWWRRDLAQTKRLQTLIRSGRYTKPGGDLMFLVSGRK
jgi:SAM-dependent methyltransferase